MISDELIRALPKTDLHLHLDGSMREQTLIDLARSRRVMLPSESVEGLNELVFKPTYRSLGEYLQGFTYTTAVLQDAEALERAGYELAWDNINEGVRYIEVRFAPQLHMHDGLDFDAVMLAADRGLARARSEHERSAAVTERGEPPFRYGLIVCAMRMFTAQFSHWYQRLLSLFPSSPQERIHSMASLQLARAAVNCRDTLGVPIVGFDLAGQEDGYPAYDHQEAYAFAHQNFLKKTVHAGEAYGAESIFQAITLLHADRIGHGYHLFSPELCGANIKDPTEYTRRLANYIADRRVTIEVCITSNLQTNPAIGKVENHAFGKMLKNRLSATLCTDNRLVSHTTVSREVRLAVDAFSLDLRELRNTIIYGFKRSFYPGSYPEKRAYVRQIIDYYDRVSAAAVASEAEVR
ncbi:MAG: adenosine deaminase [Myxococcota bacterium]|jgi:adenosine deaminase